MNNWFECKIQYNKIDPASGKEKTVKEPYLVDAVSFTEAESRILKLKEEELGDEFIVADLKKVNFSDIFNYDDSEQWYKSKVVFIDVDEKSGREKRTNNQMLVAAKTVKEAYERIEENLKEVLIPYEIVSITLSPIIEVFPYFTSEDQPEVPDNLKPLADQQAETGETAENSEEEPEKGEEAGEESGEKPAGEQ